MRFVFRLLSIVLVVLAMAQARGDGEEAPSVEDLEFFEAKIRPILVDRCISCHGPEKQKSGLRLDLREAALKGGSFGPAVVPGDPSTSTMIDALSYEGDVSMPPKGKLPDAEIAVLTDWVRRGAAWPETKANASADASRGHWAFQPVADPAAPPVKAEDWPRSPIDRFVLARLEAKGLAPSPPADRRTLIRRASFDLLGLPPSAEEVSAFEGDPRPTDEAFSTLVDRLLASPRYGERWGRHWLDVARYADTKGYVFTDDPELPWAWAYRDWVVRAINEDLSYDQFLIQQIAADRLPLGEDRRPLAAMGFLTVGSRFMNNNQDILDDRIDVVTRGLMGLTVTCARCHDHKFDPIPTQDYYSLYGVFASSKEPDVLPLFEDPPHTKEFEAFQAELGNLERAISEYLDVKHRDLVASARSRMAEYLVAAHKAGDKPSTRDLRRIAREGDLNPVMLDRWKAYLDRDATSRNPVFAAWHELRALPGEGFADRASSLVAGWSANPDPARPIHPLILEALDEGNPADLPAVAAIYARVLNATETIWEDYARTAAHDGKPTEALPDPLREELRQVFHGPDAPPELGRHAATDRDLLPNRESQEEYKKKRQEVEDYRMKGPGAPPRAMVLEDASTPVEPHVFRRGNPGNQGEAVPRRFLKVIAGESREPFRDGSGRLEMARAIASPENPLTARVLVNRVWMHHFGQPIVATPSDFGLRSDPPTHPELLDHLARAFMADGWSLKRLHKRLMLTAAYAQASDDRPEARAIDPENSLLWRMNRARLDFESTRDAMLKVSGRLDDAIGGPPAPDLLAPSMNRRTLYGKIDRLRLPGLYRAFDYPDTNATNARRDRTTVAPQALFLMNHPFAIDSAHAVLERPEVAAEVDLLPRVQRLYRLLYNREPTAREAAIASTFLEGADRSAWDRYVQGLLITNEFVFVD